MLVTGTEFLDAGTSLGDLTGVFGMLISGDQLPVPVLETLVAEAAASGCSALALRVSDQRRSIVAAVAESAGIAVLDVREHVSWRRLDAFVSSLLAERGPGIGGDPHADTAEPLYAIADSVAEVFGGSVAVEDLRRNVLAYSSVPGQLIDPLRMRGILARQVPVTPKNDTQYREVLRAEGMVAFARFRDELARAAIAVRAGSVPLGTIWAIDARPAAKGVKRSAKETILQDAANAAAGHLMRSWQVQGANRRPRESVLRRLLHGTDLTGTEWLELGVAEGAAVTLAGFGIPSGPLAPAALEQVHTTVRNHFEGFSGDTATVAADGTVWVLLTRSTPEVAHRLAEQVLPRLDHVVDVPVVAAIAQPAAHGGTLVSRRQEAASIIRAAGAAPRRVLSREDVLARLVLDTVAHALTDDPLLGDEALDRLLETAQGRTIAQTLLAWSAHHGNVAATAVQLGVHENTVRYRLQRAAEVHGIRTDAPDERLVLWLRLRLRLGS